MIEHADAIGEVVTGGMAARVVEPQAGESRDAHGRTCLNCGTGLVGDFCHGCGQQGHVHRSLGAFGHDIVHGVFHFEGKFWRTLPLLAWRPGELTRRYVEGERARFLSPMALFLFSVFVMFAVFNSIGPTAFQDRRPAAERQAAEAAATKRAASPAEMDLSDSPPALRWLDEPYRKAQQNPSLLFYKLQSNAYKFSWALIPISVPFLWLLFLHRARYRRRYKAYDHLVFVTYSISFMSIGAIGLTLLKLTGLNGTAALLPVLIVPVHMYRQLRGAYELSRWSALWRTLVLMNFAVLAGIIFSALLLMLGVFG